MENQIIARADGVSLIGGTCQCPDGQIYQVGTDRGFGCESMDLSCINGIPITAVYKVINYFLFF